MNMRRKYENKEIEAETAVRNEEIISNYQLFVDHIYNIFTDIDKWNINKCVYVRELKDISLQIQAYHQVDFGQTSVKSNIYLLNTILEYNPCINNDNIAKVLIDSELLYYLCQCIFQQTDRSLEINKITTFGEKIKDSNTRNIIYGILYPICKKLKESINIDLNILSIKEIGYLINSGYISCKNKLVVARLKELLVKECARKDIYCIDRVVLNTIVDLCLSGYNEIVEFKEIIEEMDIYKIIMEPWNINYEKVDIMNYTIAKKKSILNNAKSYGGYELYIRVYNAIEMNPELKNNDALKTIISDNAFSMILYNMNNNKLKES